MDKTLYTAMSGATRIMETQQVKANNIANLSTTGFKADFNNAFAEALQGEGFDSRVHTRNAEQWTDMSGGSLSQTGNELDVAIRGEGWFSVLDAEGNESYTRAGRFHVDGNGIMRTDNGMMVAGEGGAIMLPEYEQLDIGEDGVVTVIPSGAGNEQVMQVAQLKLVNPPAADLTKSPDGLFRLPEGEVAAEDPEVALVSGYLEGSNVNGVSEMVSFLSMSRGFEMQLKMMKSAETVARAGDQLLRD